MGFCQSGCKKTFRRKESCYGEVEESRPGLSQVRMGVECSDQQEQGSERARFTELWIQDRKSHSTGVPQKGGSLSHTPVNPKVVCQSDGQHQGSQKELSHPCVLAVPILSSWWQQPSYFKLRPSQLELRGRGILKDSLKRSARAVNWKTLGTMLCELRHKQLQACGKVLHFSLDFKT